MAKTLIYLLIAILTLASCDKQGLTKAQAEYDKMLSAKTDSEILVARQYVTDSLDFIQLDSLGLYDSFLNAWAGLYSGNTSGLATDSKKVIDRLAKESPEKIPAFIATIVKSSALADYPTAAASIAAYPYGIDVDADEHSEIALRLLTQTRLPGSAAPQIDGLQPIMGKTIVLFYESDCPSCIDITTKLVNEYSRLKQKGIDVISIASDNSREQYEQGVKGFPWLYKICDFQGFSSPTFKRWGIAATPAMFFVNEKGIVDMQPLGSDGYVGMVDKLLE
jgi:thiol-disulfide isomerase/thioredoxin